MTLTDRIRARIEDHRAHRVTERAVRRLHRALLAGKVNEDEYLEERARLDEDGTMAP